jgi:hypothetical protein
LPYFSSIELTAENGWIGAESAPPGSLLRIPSPLLLPAHQWPVICRGGRGEKEEEERAGLRRRRRRRRRRRKARAMNEVDDGRDRATPIGTYGVGGDLRSAVLRCRRRREGERERESELY